MKTDEYLRRFDECAERASLFRDELIRLFSELKAGASQIHKTSCRSIAKRIGAIPHLADADAETKGAAQSAIEALIERANEPRQRKKAVAA